jgi:hypothetical protein
LGGMASQFFAACGFDIIVDAKLAPKDAEGKELLVRFIQAANTDFQPCAFDSLRTEKHHDQPPD